MTYHSRFGSHLLYGSQLWGQANIETQNKIKKLQDKALLKIMYKKKQDPAEQLYKKLGILKFPDIVHLQNCLFMSQIETNKKLKESFTQLKHCSDNHNYQTRAKSKRLLDIPYFNTNWNYHMEFTLLNKTA